MYIYIYIYTYVYLYIYIILVALKWGGRPACGGAVGPAMAANNCIALPPPPCPSVDSTAEVPAAESATASSTERKKQHLLQIKRSKHETQEQKREQYRQFQWQQCQERQEMHQQLWQQQWQQQEQMRQQLWQQYQEKKQKQKEQKQKQQEQKQKEEHRTKFWKRFLKLAAKQRNEFSTQNGWEKPKEEQQRPQYLLTPEAIAQYHANSQALMKVKYANWDALMRPL